MNRQELITEISNRTELNKKDTENVVATFDVVERAARTARNPKTGESIEVGASKSPKFKPAKALKESVNI